MEANSGKRGSILRTFLCVILFLLVVEMIANVSFNGRVLDFWGNLMRRELNISASLVNAIRFKMTNSTNSSIPAITEIPQLPLCPEKPEHLVGPLATYTNAPTYEELKKIYPSVKPGGRYTPKECTARHRTAVVIPFRNRDKHLRTFLYNIHPFLQRQQLDYGIFVVNQVEGSKFNRAMLMNIGYAEAIKTYNYTCFVFHDVDLIPEDDRNIYGCFGNPRHMSAAIDKFNYRLPYKAIFGGVSSLSRVEFEKVNGFSNKYFGWGGEDDDMWNRIHFSGLKVVRYPMDIAKYKMIKHGRDNGNVANGERFRLLKETKQRYKTDGINNLRYEVQDLEFRGMFTWVSVIINEKEVLKT